MVVVAVARVLQLGLAPSCADVGRREGDSGGQFRYRQLDQDSHLWMQDPANQQGYIAQGRSRSTLQPHSPITRTKTVLPPEHTSTMNGYCVT
jgi:hypothetical protein